MNDRSTAALLRAEKMSGTRTGSASRPSQRRCRPEEGDGLGMARGGSCSLVRYQGRTQQESPGFTLTTSAGSVALRSPEDPSGALAFEGFASVTGQGYEMWDMFGPYTEFVNVGAFAQTLAQPDLDVPLVLDHVSSQRLARTGNAASPLMLTEVTTGDTTGLHCLAPTLQRDNPWVQQIEPLLRSGLIDEMSFRFVITSGRWSEDWMEYHIDSVDIHRGDVAIVGYGANPHTAGSGLRSQPPAPVVPSIRPDEGLLRVI